MLIEAIHALKDNYIWAITDQAHCVIIDPGEAEPVFAFLENKNLTLSAILITHHHWDHCNGIEAIIKKYPAPVYASQHETVLHKTHGVQEQQQFTIKQLGLNFNVIEIPGHTLGHVAYIAEDSIFCGDTLFSAGCGRVFEGTFEMMYNTLQKIAALPDSTKIYCGHEYTINNLKFAKTVEPNNHHIDDAMNHALQQRAQNKPTLPTLLQNEKLVNPFLRCDAAAIIESAEKQAGKKLSTPVEVFTVLRKMKDEFVV